MYYVHGYTNQEVNTHLCMGIYISVYIMMCVHMIGETMQVVHVLGPV